MKLRLKPLAVQDIAAASRWYDEQSPSLVDRFAQALGLTFDLILQHPRAFPVVHRGARRAMVVGPFSAYQVFYRATDTAVVVVAVIHGARHARHWKRRL
jgi:plasmid stabilization system protein ParE